MEEAFKKFLHQISMVTASATSLPASGSGPMPSGFPDGMMIGRSGQDLAPASPSPVRERGSERQTGDTCGPSSSGSSVSADLGRSLASRLQDRLPLPGLMLYRMTWKTRVTPSGRQICALRALGHRTSGSGCTGWPTTAARDWRDGRSNQHGKNARPLNEMARLTGWPTPDCQNGRDVNIKRLEAKGNHAMSLHHMAALTGWPTPRREDSESTGAHRGTPAYGNSLVAPCAAAFVKAVMDCLP